MALRHSGASRAFIETLRGPGPADFERAPVQTAPGRFISGTHSNSLGSRDYKLYIPATHCGQPMPLIVMLHGCQQDPDDFAVGTRMNDWADAHGFLVAYPRQTFRSNGANCWNWYEPAQQKRSGQEPSLVAGIVKAIGREWAVAPEQVFVAGLSAGAAMAVILGQTYPALFAGVAAHSGLPRGAAQDVGSAFAAMQGRGCASATLPYARSGKAVRTLIVHGDADRTVQVGNGHAIAQQVVQAFSRNKTPLLARTGATDIFNDNKATRTDYVAPTGQVMVRECIVKGGVHAWYGGCTAGSFTQATGPDSSGEIVRFFLNQEPAQ